MLEHELKLAVARRDLAKVFRIRSVMDAMRSAPRRRLNRESYFDTPDFDLRRQGIDLRVKKLGREWIQTVKVSGNGSIGLHSRAEYECTVAGEQPDLARAINSGMPSTLLSPDMRRHIRKIFEIHSWRRQASLDYAGGTSIDLCAETGEAIAGKSSVPICEVELELKQGRPDSLFEIAQQLAENIDVRLNFLTKPDLGYRLIQGHEPKPVFAKDTVLTSGQTIEDVFVHLLNQAVEHAFANEEAVLESDDIEGVHQMRVGLRRFRSVLSVFKHVIPGRCCERVKKTVQPLLAALGPARDWDVFITEQLAFMRQSMPAAEHFAKLERVAKLKRDGAYRNLRALMQSREYHRATLTLISWIACRGWRTAMTAEECALSEEPADKFMQRELQRGHKRVRHLGHRIRKRTIAELHRLRISAKRQRYSVEFFESRFPAKQVRGYRAALKEMQTDLGLLNDGATANRLLEEIGQEPEMHDSVLFAKGWVARKAVESNKHLSEVWKSFKRQRAFWKKPMKVKKRKAGPTTGD